MIPEFIFCITDELFEMDGIGFVDLFSNSIFKIHLLNIDFDKKKMVFMWFFQRHFVFISDSMELGENGLVHLFSEVHLFERSFFIIYY